MILKLTGSRSVEWQVRVDKEKVTFLEKVRTEHVMGGRGPATQRIRRSGQLQYHSSESEFIDRGIGTRAV